MDDRKVWQVRKWKGWMMRKIVESKKMERMDDEKDSGK